MKDVPQIRESKIRSETAVALLDWSFMWGCFGLAKIIIPLRNSNAVPCYFDSLEPRVKILTVVVIISKTQMDDPRNVVPANKG